MFMEIMINNDNESDKNNKNINDNNTTIKVSDNDNNNNSNKNMHRKITAFLQHDEACVLPTIGSSCNIESVLIMPSLIRDVTN